jgi:hypothetical protein
MMRLMGGLLALLSTGVLLAAPLTATAAPPQRLFVPGTSLGGAKLGMTKREISRLWGPAHGVCRSCRLATWYFNEKPFAPQGLGVAFEQGLAVFLFTIWQPHGYRTPLGLELGDPAPRITQIYGPLERRLCAGYEALVRPGRKAASAFYVDRDVLWGFGLTTPGASPCL